MLMGTPAYMAPEQVQGARDADARSDVWGLGVMMFELIAGRLPFDAIHRVNGAALERILPAAGDAVESTVAALKRPFNNDQLPVRGRFRVNHLIVGSALMVNLRRIHRYVSEKIHKARLASGSTADQAPAPTLADSFFAALPTLRARLCWRRAFGD